MKKELDAFCDVQTLWHTQNGWSFYFWANHAWERHLNDISLDKKLACFGGKPTSFGFTLGVRPGDWGETNRKDYLEKVASSRSRFCKMERGRSFFPLNKNEFQERRFFHRLKLHSTTWCATVICWTSWWPSMLGLGDRTDWKAAPEPAQST